MNRTLCFLLLFVNGVATGAFSLSPNGRSGRSMANTAPTRTESPPPLSTALNLSGGGGDVDGDADAPSLRREMMAEAVGTYLIVQIGCGVVCTATCLGAQVGLWQIAAAWSIAVTLAISATASISGAHLNPAISFALALLRPSGRFGWGKLLPYVASQVFGAALAGLSNLVLFRDALGELEAAKGIVRGAAESVASASVFGEYWSVSSWRLAFFAEALGTAILAFVVFALTNPGNKSADKNPVVPAVVGATVGALISFLAPLTQAGFNPARDFGPRIVAYFAGWRGVAMKGWWLYVLAPLVGAPVGAMLADNVLYKDESSDA